MRYITHPDQLTIEDISPGGHIYIPSRPPKWFWIGLNRRMDELYGRNLLQVGKTPDNQAHTVE